jgi:hypothetical protein
MKGAIKCYSLQIPNNFNVRPQFVLVGLLREFGTLEVLREVLRNDAKKTNTTGI